MLLTVCVGVQVIVCLLLYNKIRCIQKKKKEGIEIPGKQIGYKEIPGQPTRYLIVTEYEIAGIKKRKRIITSDKTACKLKDEEEIALIYVHSLDKIFWADEKKYADIPTVIFLVIISVFMWVLMCLTFLKITT